MTEERPRPQYGEYASPEDQARAANRNVPQRRTVGPPLPPREPPPPVSVESAPPGLYPVAKHPVDRAISIVLLVFGAFSLINSIPQYVSWSSTISLLYSQFGAPTYPKPEVANTVGIVLLVVHLALFLGTLLLTVRRLVRGAWTFFVPLIGFAGYLLMFAVGMFVLWGAAPSWFDAVLKSMSGSL